MSRPFHSIRWRVQAWHGAILLVVILAFCATAHRLVWSNQMRNVDRTLGRADHTLMRALMQRAEAAMAKEGTALSPTQAFELLRRNPSVPAAVAPMFNGTDPGYLYFSLRDGEGRVLLESPNVPKEADFWPARFTDAPDEARQRGGRRELLRSMPAGVHAIFGMDLRLERQEMRRFTLSIGALGLGVWTLGLLGGWWIAGRAIKPIAAISRTATRIAEGNLSERISTEGTDSELDQLGQVLNETFSRLHRAFERQKQFTADASHELRTPVTILLSETQRLLKRERTAEEYREGLQTCQATALRMSQLIEALLVLARQDAEGGERPRDPCDLSGILGETAAQLAPIAAGRGLRISQVDRPAPCLGDRAALSILATNIVANAIQHHDRKEGLISIETGIDGASAFFRVSDDGPGIPAKDLPNIFERFYRADPARSGKTEHAGLGLAIAQTIAQNHGGGVSVENRPSGRGCAFTVRVPASRT